MLTDLKNWFLNRMVDAGNALTRMINGQAQPGDFKLIMVLGLAICIMGALARSGSIAVTGAAICCAGIVGSSWTDGDKDDG